MDPKRATVPYALSRTTFAEDAVKSHKVLPDNILLRESLKITALDRGRSKEAAAVEIHHVFDIQDTYRESQCPTKSSWTYAVKGCC